MVIGNNNGLVSESRKSSILNNIALTFEVLIYLTFDHAVLSLGENPSRTMNLSPIRAELKA